MTSHFLPDATDFTDLPALPDPGLTYADKAGYVPCPLCHGHGYWNLTLHAYGSGKHFRAACRQCWSWGWVPGTSTDATCLHTYVEVAPAHPWRCYHTIECTTCKARKSYSSDD